MMRRSRMVRVVFIGPGLMLMTTSNAMEGCGSETVVLLFFLVLLFFDNLGAFAQAIADLDAIVLFPEPVDEGERFVIAARYEGELADFGFSCVRLFCNKVIKIT